MWSVVMASWQRWTLARLRRKWSINLASWQRWMLSRLQYKYWCNFNASASANVQCCHGFMVKMNVGMASVQMMVRFHSRCKCKYCFMAKMNVGTVLWACFLRVPMYLWRCDFARLGFFLERSTWNSTLGRIDQWLSVYF